MDIRIDSSLVGNPLEALRRAGYFPFRDPKSGENSFICRLGPDFYPRFHLYLQETAKYVTLSLHLDQKQPSYGGAGHKHNGEYEGERIEQEMKRIHEWILHVHQERGPARDIASSSPSESGTQKPWWKIWK